MQAIDQNDQLRHDLLVFRQVNRRSGFDGLAVHSGMLKHSVLLKFLRPASVIEADEICQRHAAIEHLSADENV
jgi:hypothetical protein